MPTLYPGSLIPWIEQRFFDADGNPLIGGKVQTLEAGTSTPLATYSDVDLTEGTEHTNPIILDGEARPENGPIYLQARGYKFVVKDANDVEQYTVDMVADAGQVLASSLGNVLASGSKNVVSGYQCLVTDRLVTVDADGGPSPCIINLLPASEATQPLTIKNFAVAVPLAVTAAGADTIDANVSVYTVPVALNPVAPSIMLVSDGISDWYILASHGLVT